MGTGKPLIAILMAVYEPRMDWLQEQLESLNAQTYPNLRLYIRMIVPRPYHLKKSGRWRKCASQNSRLPSPAMRKTWALIKPFERLTEEAEGDLFAYCDQDDVWLPEKLEILQEEMETHRRPAGVLRYGCDRR